MRTSIGLLAATLLMNAVFAEESIFDSAESVSNSVQLAEHSLYYNGEHDMIENGVGYSMNYDAIPEFYRSENNDLGKRDGNMQQVLESLANLYYASASLESADMAHDEQSNAPEEVASDISQVPRQRKHLRLMKRGNHDYSIEQEASMLGVSMVEEEASVSDYFSAMMDQKAFAPISQAYLPVYYRRAKRQVEIGDEQDDEFSSFEDTEEPSLTYHHHHDGHHLDWPHDGHHSDWTHDGHHSDWEHEDWYHANHAFEDAPEKIKRDELTDDAVDSSVDAESVFSEEASSSVEDIASKIAKDVQDQINKALGEEKPPHSLEELALMRQENAGEFWIADENQFKGYDWKESE